MKHHMRYIQVFAWICVCIALLTSCSLQANSYRPLSPAEVGRFVAQQQVALLGTKDLGDGTVILYEEAEQVGYFIVSVDKNGQLAQQQAFVNDAGNTPISTATVSTGTPCMMIIINDQRLIQQAETVKVLFTNDSEVTEPTNAQKGVIIVDPGAARGWQQVAIYDQAGQELLKVTPSTLTS